jgi:hypothetical protein
VTFDNELLQMMMDGVYRILSVISDYKESGEFDLEEFQSAQQTISNQLFGFSQTVQGILGTRQ